MEVNAESILRDDRFQNEVFFRGDKPVRYGTVWCRIFVPQLSKLVVIGGVALVLVCALIYGPAAGFFQTMHALSAVGELFPDYACVYTQF